VFPAGVRAKVGLLFSAGNGLRARFSGRLSSTSKIGTPGSSLPADSPRLVFDAFGHWGWSAVGPLESSGKARQVRCNAFQQEIHLAVSNIMHSRQRQVAAIFSSKAVNQFFSLAGQSGPTRKQPLYLETRGFARIYGWHDKASDIGRFLGGPTRRKGNGGLQEGLPGAFAQTRPFVPCGSPSACNFFAKKIFSEFTDFSKKKGAAVSPFWP